MNEFDHQSGQTLSVDGADLYYQVQGPEDAHPLLLLHGGFGTMKDFTPLLEELRNYRVIALDSRGHGKSSLGPQALSYERLQKDAEALLAHLKVKTVTLLGFSDGGIVSLRLASLTKLKVERLIVIGARWNPEDDPKSIKVLSGVTGASWRKKFPETYELYQAVNPQPDFDELAKQAVKMWLDQHDSGYPGAKIGKIGCPTLLVHGDQDHLVPAGAMLEAHRQIKNSHFFNIPLAGHVAYADQVELFNLGLRKFLQGS